MHCSYRNEDYHQDEDDCWLLLHYFSLFFLQFCEFLKKGSNHRFFYLDFRSEHSMRKNPPFLVLLHHSLYKFHKREERRKAEGISHDGQCCTFGEPTIKYACLVPFISLFHLCLDVICFVECDLMSNTELLFQFLIDFNFQSSNFPLQFRVHVLCKERLSLIT